MNAHEIDPQVYSQQLTEKSDYLDELFAGVSKPELEIFPSPPIHYRQRTEFRVWHDGDDLYYVMFKPETREPYRVDQFPPGSQLINELMPLLIAAIKNNPVLRKKIFQIDFLTTLSGEGLVSLLYHRKLDEQWIVEARALREQFIEQGFRLDFIGRSRKQKILLDRDFVLEQLQVDGRVLTYKQIENSFTQPNAKVAERMLEWALDCTRGSTGDLLELYCGNGNFSLALSPNFRRVLATEQSRPSVNAARHNCAVNEIDNVDIVRLSAEELTAAIEGRGQFTRLQNAGVDLSSFNCNTVLVDPPRAGVDERTCGMLQTYDQILYISCNPQTLLANLELLLQTHQIERMAMFDQFPYTHHIELGVLLVRKE